MDVSIAGWHIPIKDLVDAVGFPTGFGSVGRTRWPDTDDPFVATLKALGATVPGKTATRELGLTAYCEPVGEEPPTNPLWPGMTTGGSSGGAAEAAYTFPVTHGTDGGGSIRVPAAACGLYGIKLPHNPVGGQPSAHGFLSRSLTDLATVTSAVTAAMAYGGEGNRSPDSPRRRPGNLPTIGYLTEPLHIDTHVDPVMVEATRRVAELLGARQVPRPYDYDHFEAFAQVFMRRTTTITGPLTPIGSWLREMGRTISDIQYNQAVTQFMSTTGLVKRLAVDVLITPVLAYDPPPIGYFSAMPPEEDFWEQTRWTPWATIANMMGAAALTIPVPVEGRPPVGVELIAVNCTVAELFQLAEKVCVM